MRRSTHWIIAIFYYGSQALGLLSFSYNWRTGLARTKLSTSLYCGILSLGMFGIVPLLWQVDWKLTTTGADLHIKISGIMCLIRVAAVLVTITWNWTKRKEFIATINDFQELREKFLQKWPINEDLENRYEHDLRFKTFLGVMVNVMMLCASLHLMKYHFDMPNHVVAFLAIICSILNVIMMHYYFAVINFNILLETLNQQIEKNLQLAHLLFIQQRSKFIKPGLLVSYCCQLADDMDDLAMFQYKLIILSFRINKMYDVQGACVVLTVYLNNISVIYMSYMLLNHKSVANLYDSWSVGLMIAGLSLYYWDLKRFMYSLLDFLTLAQNPGKLLRDYQKRLPTLDARLEESLKNFSLQLAKFPVEMKLVGLFEFGRPMVFAIFGSTISNAIVLMQYDYRNNRND